jgi:hypothetical protein
LTTEIAGLHWKGQGEKGGLGEVPRDEDAAMEEFVLQAISRPLLPLSYPKPWLVYPPKGQGMDFQDFHPLAVKADWETGKLA